MTRVRSASIRLPMVALACLATFQFAAALQAQEHKVGDRVVAVRDVALRVPEGNTASVVPGYVLTVSAIDGNWLWVNAGQAGWIHRDNVVPLSAAHARFDALARRSRGDRRWVYARALVAHELGDVTAAVNDLSQLVRRYPRDASYRLARGFAYYEQGKPEEAVVDFSAALEIDADNVKALNNRANVYVNLGDYDAAVADLDRAIQLDEKNTAAYNNRGHAHEMRGNYEQAMSDYRRATELDPKYALAANNLAWLAATCPDVAVRDSSTAVARAVTACELTNYEQPLFLSTLAAAYAEQGDFDKAVETQQQANRLAEDQLPEEFEQRLEAFKQGRSYVQSSVDSSN